MAVASAGPYASLHLAPDRYPRQYPTTLFFTGRMPFLPPNQQRQSTEGFVWRLRGEYYQKCSVLCMTVIHNGMHANMSSLNLCLVRVRLVSVFFVKGLVCIFVFLC